MLTVRFPMASLRGQTNDIFVNITLLRTLREKGIPVIGNISVQGIEHGTLAVRHDTAAKECVYEWTPDDDEI